MLTSILLDSNGVPSQILIGKNIKYNLSQISAEELYKHRLSGERGIVYKCNDKLFFASVSHNLHITFMKNPHLCGLDCSRICKDCPKSRDFTVSYQLKDVKRFPIAVQKSWRIEKYPFILEGVETFNMPRFYDSHYVCACSKYIPYESSKKISLSDISEKKARLASLYFEDFDGKTMSDFRRWRWSTK